MTFLLCSIIFYQASCDKAYCLLYMQLLPYHKTAWLHRHAMLQIKRDKTSKNSYRKISLASGSVRIFLMETSNSPCLKDLETDPSPYRLHRSEFNNSIHRKRNLTILVLP